MPIVHTDEVLGQPKYSFVIPIFNEEDTIPELSKRLGALMGRLDGAAEAILVDDGSHDASYPALLDLHLQDRRFKPVQLSRNFGHQVAITAGMDYSVGQAVIIMDADLQDPPEVVLEMIDRWKEGYEVVFGVRESRLGESRFKLITARVFYAAMRKLSNVEIPMDVGDFRLVDRRAIDAFKTLRETSRYVRGMFSWIGFRQIGVKYRRDPRFAGKTKYPLRKMLRLAVNGIVSFSDAPLRLALNLGFLISMVAVFGGLAAIALRVTGMYLVPGWTSIIVVVAFLGGINLVVLGMMGEYVGRIFEEAKNRPLYIVRDLHGFPGGSSEPLDATVDRVPSRSN